MKRKLSLIFVATICITLILCCFCACDKKNGANKNDNICRMTAAYYVGESDSFAVSIECGKREKVFIADGKATDVCEFCELTITPLKKIESESILYLISGENASLSGEVSSSNYGDYIATISLDFVPTGISLTAGDVVCDLDLSNVLDGALSSYDVVNIAKNEFNERIEKELADGKSEREIYVKLISGDGTNFYYYVSFIGEGVDYWAVLVDVRSGEIVSKK